MNVDGTHYRSIWFNSTTKDVGIIDQRWLPSEFRIATLKTRDQFATAIRDMWVRGAPLLVPARKGWPFAFKHQQAIGKS